jgi:ribosomal protein S6--L-glutamate ligase
MRHLVALVSGFGWHVQDLRRAAQRLDIRFDAAGFSRVISRVGISGVSIEASGLDLTAVNGVLVRMMPPGSLEQVVYRMDALHRLEAMGIPVVNPPRSVETAVDKFLALAKLEGEGLKTPPTWVGESAPEALKAFEWLGGDVVVKPLFGSEGRGLVRVSDLELARRAVFTLERLNSVIYMQTHVENEGFDVRAFVVGERILGAVRRYPAEGQWRTNLSLGGRAEAVRLDEEARALAIRAARAVGARVAGVDLLPGRDGWYVLEVNAVPGWRGLSEATGIDVAAEVLGEVLR